MLQIELCLQLFIRDVLCTLETLSALSPFKLLNVSATLQQADLPRVHSAAAVTTVAMFETLHRTSRLIPTVCVCLFC